MLRMNLSSTILSILLASATSPSEVGVDPSPASPPPAAVSPSNAAATASALRAEPVRSAHPLVLGADVGWNSLAGAGLRASWAFTPHLAVDVGAGYALSGPKGGARVRWNFLTADVTPFVALGAFASAGRSSPQVISQSGGDQFTFHVGPAAYAQAVGGLEYQSSERITYSFELGWAQALTHRDLHVISGTPDDVEWKQVRWVAGGGPVVGGSVGYAF